jgi:penicillin-binding protein-related factor A (putative recombinase)
LGIGTGGTLITPTEHLTGAKFEAIVKERCVQLKNLRLADIGRYGVQAVRTGDAWQVMQSLPDFEGVTREGRQAIFDAKVCSQSSFALDKYRPDTKGSRSRQLRHMLDRSEFGVRCFFLIHWNERQLTTRKEPAITYAFPVELWHPFWRSFLAGEIKSIKRTDCETFGHAIAWNHVSSTDRKLRPDILAAVVQTPHEVEIGA